MTHDGLVAAVGELAGQRGLLWVYFPRSLGVRGCRGFPDLVIAGPGGVAFAECKTGTGLEPAQQRWRDALRGSGASWHLWQPADLWSGRIRDALDALAA